MTCIVLPGTLFALLTDTKCRADARDLFADIEATMFPAELQRPLNKRVQVFAQGDSVTSVYLIQSGAISLGRSNADGKEVNVAFLGAGDFFGEEALFGRGLRHTTAVCVDAGSIFGVSPELFVAAIHSDPALPMRLASNLSLRFDQITQALEDLAFATVEMRLLMLFDRLANRFGVPTVDGVAINLRLTHAQIGTFIGSTRETVSAQLASLMRRQRLRLNGPYYVLVCQQGVACAAHEAVPSREHMRWPHRASVPTSGAHGHAGRSLTAPRLASSSSR